MSEENEGGENNQTDALSELDDFEFYFRFIKPLVLELPTEEDRGIGAAWAQKLEQIPETEEESQQRLNYVKLLLFVLQRGRLSGIFKKQPPSGPLQPFPQGFSILDMGNWMLDQDDAQTCGGGDAGRVPYDIELSNDLREYAASQEVPNFGVQMYYAWSSEDPINKWLLFDEDKFPHYILDKIKQLNETKSDEKTTIARDGCTLKKRGCDLNLLEKYSKKKVKSPQEIEKSQGRSFHTYMGLVGRMGNFNDKCDDDPEKYQRQEQRRGKCPKKSNGEKRCVANAGEAEDMAGEEDYDNLVTGLGGGGGLNAQNRPCLCLYPFTQQNCPEQQAKGGLQPFENQQSPFVVRGNNTENFHYSEGRSVSKSSGGRCLERGVPQPLTTMRNIPRQRSASPNLPNVNCPSEGDPREFQNQGRVCICSNPPCTCPCPRGAAQGQIRPNVTPAAGTVCPELSRTYDKSLRPDQTGGRRDMGPGFISFRAQDPCTPLSSRPDISPGGGRTNATTGLKPINPEIIHCYDNQNPDPALTQTLNKSTDWVQCGSALKFADTSFKIAQERVSLITSARENRSDLNSRRVLFENQSPDFAGTSCQQTEGHLSISPLENDPLCENSSPEVTYDRSSPRLNQMGYPQLQTPHHFQDCEGSVNEAVPQTMTRPTNQPIYDTNTQDFQKMVSFLKKFKQVTKETGCTQESQPGQMYSLQSQSPQVYPLQPQPQPSQLGAQQPRPAQVCPPQTQSTQVYSQSLRSSQMSPQQLRRDQVCPQQPQLVQSSPQQSRRDQTCPQQPQPSHVCPQQPQSSHVCLQQPRPAQVSTQSPRPAQISPQQLRHDQVCPQQPQIAQMSPQQLRHDQVCPQQPQIAQMSPQQLRHDQVCPQQPQIAQMSPQQPRRDQVCTQQSQPSHVCPKQPRSPQLCSQQPRFSQVCPQQPRSTQMSPPQPRPTPLCSQSHQPAQASSLQVRPAQVCLQQPQLTQMYPQHHQPTQMYKIMPQPTQMLQQQPRPSQGWPQQSRSARVVFQDSFDECTSESQSPQTAAQPSQPVETAWQEPKVAEVDWHEFPEGNSQQFQSAQCRSQSPQAAQGRSQSPQTAQGRSQSPLGAPVCPTPPQTGQVNASQDECSYPQQLGQQPQICSSTPCSSREVDQQHEFDTVRNNAENSAAQCSQSAIFHNEVIQRTCEDTYLDFCNELNARQRTHPQLESTRIQAPATVNGYAKSPQNCDSSYSNREVFQQVQEANFPSQNSNALQQPMGRDCGLPMPSSGSVRQHITEGASVQELYLKENPEQINSHLMTADNQCERAGRQNSPTSVPIDIPPDSGTICEKETEVVANPGNPDIVRRIDSSENVCDGEWFF